MKNLIVGVFRANMNVASRSPLSISIPITLRAYSMAMNCNVEVCLRGAKFLVRAQLVVLVIPFLEWKSKLLG